MHEMSLAESVQQIIEEHARTEGFSRVLAVRLEIGMLAGVEPEALRFCFEAAMLGSMAEGARLEIVETPGSGWCRRCDVTVPMAERYSACPHCGGYELQPNGGTEMRITELEVK